MDMQGVRERVKSYIIERVHINVLLVLLSVLSSLVVSVMLLVVSVSSANSPTFQYVSPLARWMKYKHRLPTTKTGPQQRHGDGLLAEVLAQSLLGH
jgi:hypothetical protein